MRSVRVWVAMLAGRTLIFEGELYRSHNAWFARMPANLSLHKNMRPQFRQTFLPSTLHLWPLTNTKLNTTALPPPKLVSLTPSSALWDVQGLMTELTSFMLVAMEPSA